MYLLWHILYYSCNLHVQSLLRISRNRRRCDRPWNRRKQRLRTLYNSSKTSVLSRNKKSTSSRNRNSVHSIQLFFHTYTHTHNPPYNPLFSILSSSTITERLKTTGIIMCIMVGIVGEDMVHQNSIFVFNGGRALWSTYYQWCLRA